MHLRTASLSLLTALAIASGPGLSARAQTSAAAPRVITNTASMSFIREGVAKSVSSNSVSVAVRQSVVPTIQLMRLSGGSPGEMYDASAGRCMLAGAWVPIVTTSVQNFNPANVKLTPADTYEPGDPIFVKVVATDSNLDPTVRETITVTVKSGGDTETANIRETGPNTGVFVGFVNSDDKPTDVGNDCSLSLYRGGALSAAFDDQATIEPEVTADALVDPFGYVFSSSTALPVSGAKITLIDESTGQPATVFGEDGVSAYPSTVVSGDTIVDAGGRIYANRVGQFRFPKAATGNYHLQIVPPDGYSAPSTVPLATLQALVTPINTSFVLPPASFGKSFSLMQGVELQIDVPIDPHSGALVLDKTASVTDASLGDLVQYQLKLANPDARSSDTGVKIIDVLPRGFRYVAGSVRRDGLKLADPAVAGDGRTLTFTLGGLAAGASTEVRYMTRLGADVASGDAINRANATDASGSTSNTAEARIHVHAPLMTDAGTILGRVFEGDCDTAGKDRKGVPGVRAVLEDGTFVVSDKDGRFHFEAVRLGLHVVQMDVDSLPKGLVPQSCGRTTANGGRAFSRFVDLKGAALWRVDFHLRRTAAAPAAASQDAPKADDNGSAVAGEGRDWLAGQTAGPAAFLFPVEGHNPRAPAVRVVVKHAPNEVVNLSVNGAPVDPLLLDSDAKSADGAVQAIMWRGVPIREGDNALVATVTDHGREIARLTRIVHYANTPARAELVPSRSRLIADGLTRPQVAVRITDRSGRPVRAGTMGSVTVEAPYAAAAALDAQQQRQLSGLDGAAPTWRVTGDDGIALIDLAPTSQAGAATLNMPLSGDSAGHPTQVSAWLSADREQWIVAGFAAGTVGFDTLSRHAAPLQRGAGKADFSDGQIAFYAKGRIKGSWLLTLAYDNRRTADRERGLNGAIDPDRYYTVYGDGAAQAYDAATQRKLYIRLERKAFYALFGDFQTGFDQTELGRYTRSLNGLKFERHGKVVNVSGFAAESVQTQIRDEIQGLGISGPYRLSHHDLVVGSDQISIETRDRARSDHVLNTRSLSRHADYEIDTLSGQITFAAPVLATDADLNPNIVVAQYEVDDGGRKAVQAGVRASATLMGGKVKAGVTLLHDGQKLQTASGDVAAADLVIQPRADTRIKLEAAVSDPNAQGLHTQTAYLAEIEHKSANLELLGYVRQEDAAFGLNQQSGAELGARKMGIDTKLHLGAGFGLTASGWHETYMTTGATRDALDARLDYTLGDWRLNAGVKLVKDSTAAATADSTLLTFGASRDFMDHKLQVTGSTDVSLDGKAESADFPVRHRLGLSYAVTQDVRLTLSHEITEGAAYTAETTRLGADVQPWKGARITSGLAEQGVTEYGPRTFAQLGMSQSITLSKQWTVDAAVDTSTTVSGKAPTAAQINPNQPLGSGATIYSTVSQTGAPAGVIAEDFKSVSLGATYRAATWSWNARVEARFATSANTWNVRTGWLRQLGDGVVAAINLRSSATDAVGGAFSGATQVDGSIAFRPMNSRWSVLEKLTVRDDEARATEAGQTLAGFGLLAATNGSSARVINSVALNYDTAAEGQEGRGQWQVSAYYGAKYVQGRFDGDTYTGFVDVIGLEGRYDLSSRVDIGLNLAVQHAWSDHNLGFAFGPSIGLSPAANTWISVGWNVVGFRDRDFETDRYTRQGPYITARLKFDQLSLAPLLRHIQGGRP